MPIYIRSVIVVHCSVLWSWDFSYGDFRNYCMGCHEVTSQKYCTVFVLPKVLPRDYVGIGWRWLHEHEQEQASLCVRDQDVAGQVNYILHLGLCVPKTLIVVGYRSRHPDKCPRLTPVQRQPQRILIPRYQDWNHQHWSHVIFAEEYKVRLYHFDRLSFWMQQYRDIDLSARRCFRARQLQFYGLTLESSANVRWDQCAWFLCANMRRRWRWPGVSPGWEMIISCY